jgi:hypothetical protein
MKHAGETLIAAIVLSVAFVLGGRIHRPGDITRRGAISFSAGAAIAYIFVHLSPELGEMRKAALEESRQFAPRLEAYSVHLATMLGFIVFYALEVFAGGSARTAPAHVGQGGRQSRFRTQLLVFGLYAWMVAYLLNHSYEDQPLRLGLYSLAMGLHFITVGHGLHEEHGHRYLRVGAPVLGAATLIGWVAGLIAALPTTVTALLMGVVAGGVIANTVIMELPKETEGRFWPFLGGAVLYSALLLLSTG